MSYGAISDGEMKRTAEMSDETPPLYRYILGRRWGSSGRYVNFIMLNPSTADAYNDDPTIRRCIGYARGWDFDGMVVTNLFALRSPNPGRLIRAADPIGPLNDEIIAGRARRADLVVAAWGAHGKLYGRDKIVRRDLDTVGIRLHYLRLTEKGAPSHPLYLPSGLTPIEWSTSVDKSPCLDRGNG